MLIGILPLIIFIYLALQHNSNKHKSKLLQWNLESAVKCMKILRDVIGTHIPTLILGTWIPTFTAHWELRFPHVHWELGFPENFWEWHTFGNFASESHRDAGGMHPFLFFHPLISNLAFTEFTDHLRRVLEPAAINLLVHLRVLRTLLPHHLSQPEVNQQLW